MDWRFNRINVVFGLLALLGIAQFVYFTCWSIVNYPGGYSLFENFLSDLGRSKTAGGLDNSLCASFFSRSVIGLAIAIVPFYFVIPSTFDSGKSVLRFSGILSAAGLLGIGATPYDQYFVLHQVALVVWVAAMLVMVIAFLVVAQSAGADSKLLMITSFLVVIAVCGYAAAGDHNGYVVLQKIMAVLAVAWLGIVFLTVSLPTVHTVSVRRAIVEKQARQYLGTIEKNHRRYSIKNGDRTVR